VMQHVQDPEAFADALTGIYATDPNYGMTLKWVMRKYNLGAYDQ
jgi:flagellum-specific peptidoglycan hydrolase FlgJ